MIITLAEYARRNNLDLPYLARLNRSGRLIGTTKVGSTWLIDENAPMPERRKYSKQGK